MNRSDIMRISALFEIALGSASLIAARFWIGTTNIVGRHVSHGDTTEAFALTYAFTLLQITIGIIGVMNAEKGRMSTVIFGILPRWTPGTANGVPVDVRYETSFKFQYR